MNNCPIWTGQRGIARKAWAMLVNGPRAMIVTCSGAARISSVNYLFRGVLMVQFGHLEVGIAQTVLPHDVPRIGRRRAFGLDGGANSRPARRIELLDNGLHVARGLIGRNVARHGRYRNDLQTRVEQRHGQSHGVIDPRIDVQNDFSRHVSLAILVRPGSGHDCRPPGGRTSGDRLRSPIASVEPAAVRPCLPSC